MAYELLTALTGFALGASMTPGPNNLMLMASGANFGFRRSMPHMAGVALGFLVMISLVGAGLIRLFDLWPPSETVLKVVSVTYLLWLAWKIAHAAPPASGAGSEGRPLTFLQAALFQWVNPKAWTMSLSAITLYAPERNFAAIALVAMVFGAVSLLSVSTWTVLGQQVSRLLSSPARLRAFNWTMAALLVASLGLVFYHPAG